MWLLRADESADKFRDGMAMPKSKASQGFLWRLGCCAVAKTVGVPGMVLKWCGASFFSESISVFHPFYLGTLFCINL